MNFSILLLLLLFCILESLVIYVESQEEIWERRKIEWNKSQWYTSHSSH